MVEDIINELYSIGDDHWEHIVENILHILNFPVNLAFVGNWKEYLYEYLNKYVHLSHNDKNTLSECKSIACFLFPERWRKFQAVVIKISGNQHLRNEKANDLYKLFKKLCGKNIFFIVCFDDSIAFLGTSYDKNKGTETIISDWFNYESDREVLERIEEIDFATFSSRSSSKLYADYVWAIARPYIKYRESKMFLIYGCGYLDTYNSVVRDQDSGTEIVVSKVDKEATLNANLAYYLDMYGDDFFIDDSGNNEDDIDIYDEDDNDFEWTMLEMDLAKQTPEEINYNEDETYVNGR